MYKNVPILLHYKTEKWKNTFKILTKWDMRPNLFYIVFKKSNENEINIANWIKEARYLYLKVLVYRHCGGVPDPQDGRCQGCLWTQVQELPQVFMWVNFPWLKRIFLKKKIKILFKNFSLPIDLHFLILFDISFTWN